MNPRLLFMLISITVLNGYSQYSIPNITWKPLSPSPNLFSISQGYSEQYNTNSEVGNPKTINTYATMPTEGLVGWYPFNGNANDESGFGNNGSVYGASLTTDNMGILNSAYYFDGVNNYIELQHPLPIENTFTISFWTYNQQGADAGNILNDGSMNLGGNDFLLNLTSNRIGIRADKGGNNLNYEDDSPPQLTNLNISNTWSQIAWVMSPTYSQIYLNGVLLLQINEEGTNSGYHDPTSYIGTRRVWTEPDDFFHGKIDNIRIYNRILTLEEITLLSLEGSEYEPMQATNIVFSDLQSTQLSFDWTDGNGSKRVVFIKNDSIGSAYPSNNTTYNASTIFGLGDQIGTTGWYCVFNGSSHESGVTVTGLLPNTSYRVMVCEYIGSFGSEQYDTDSAIGNPKTVHTYAEMPTEGLVGWYPFNGNANDESGFGNNGSVHGASLTTDNMGLFNSAYYFDGVNNYIELQHPLPIENTFTISFWTYNQQGTYAGNILNDGSMNLGGNDFLLNLTSNTIGIRADKGGNSLNYEYGGPPQLTNLDISNNWNQIAWVMSPAYSQIYLNGVLLLQIDEEGTNTGYHDPTSYIGTRRVWTNPDNFFHGKIDNIRIYNRILTPEEITLLSLEGSEYEPMQATNIVFSDLQSTQLSFDWTDGNGSKRVVFIKNDSIGSANPSDNTTYNASTIFGLGSQIGTTGWYCVFNGSSHESGVTVTGLLPNTSYRVMVCEYIGEPGNEVYSKLTAMNNPMTQITEQTPQTQISFQEIDPLSIGIVNSQNLLAMAILDYDNDGFEDLIAADESQHLALYKNNGNGTFSFIGNAGVNHNLTSGDIDPADFNNDGYQDFIIAYTDSIRFFANNHDGSFIDVTSQLGISVPIRTGTRGFWDDYDTDGDLDFMVLTHDNTNSYIEVFVNKLNETIPSFSTKQILLTFPLPIYPYFLLIDYDNDQDQDLLILEIEDNDPPWSFYYYYPLLLYQNNKGVYSDVTVNSGLGLGSGYGFGQVWDYNNDGYADILMGSTDNVFNAQPVNRVYKNLKNGQFLDVTTTVNVRNGLDYYRIVFPEDFDNDGDVDVLYSANGHLFSNTGNGTFSSDLIYTSGLNTTAYPIFCFMDFNSDGKLDAFDTHFRPYTNISTTNNFVSVKLSGCSNFTDPRGARVCLYNSNGIQTRYVKGNEVGFSISRPYSKTLHFGIGSLNAVDSLKVFWEGGSVTTVTNVEVNSINYISPQNIPQPHATDTSLVCGGSITLMANGGTGYRWYDTSVGGTPIAIGSSFTTPYLNTTTSYYVSAKNDQCESNRDTATITVLPLSVNIVGNYGPYCIYSPPVEIQTSFPGGTFLGNGMIGNVFTPSNAGDGDHVIIYSYNNGLGCFDEDTITITVNQPPISLPPDNQILTNITIQNGQFFCSTAEHEISVAGNGTVFSIENGGTARIVAGEQIHLLPGTTIEAGGNLKVIVTSDCITCGAMKTTSVVTNSDMETSAIDSMENENNSFIKVYPNPATTKFNIEIAKRTLDMVASLRLYNMMGVLISTEIISGINKKEISLENLPNGIYLLEVIQGAQIEIVKIIKQ